jgi:predicted dehydrogenase
MLLPHLVRDSRVELRQVVTTTSLSAVNAQRKFGFDTAGTDIDEMLDDDEISAVFIVTRHHTHAGLVCRALERGKTVFVEKPLALTQAELDRIIDAIEATGNDRLMVGFNRRFAPLVGELKAQFGTTMASTARYLVNAGALGTDSWYRNEELEGSRFLGEGGHFIDLLSWWTGAVPTQVQALAAQDPHNLSANLRFADGSLAVLTYDTGGNARVPKELLDVSGDGVSARLDNFSSGTVWTGRRKQKIRARGQGKGQREQLDAFISAALTGAPMPIPLESLVATTRATIAVSESLATGSTLTI